MPESRKFAFGGVEITPGEVVVPNMRSAFVSEKREEVARVREVMVKETRAMSGRGVPKALAQAADSPVEERALLGSRAEVTEQIARYREDTGLDLLVARTQVAGASVEASRASLEALAEVCAGVR